MNILKPESYLSPFLLTYLSKYIENIEQKNLQLSLWGGDAVLNNITFKLDVLDNEVGNIPFSFVSCQAQELRIHVPWNKLTSESVVVTLNTVECVLRLNCRKNLVMKKALKQIESNNSQSSYVHMIIKKIKRNLIFKVNNLILKYVEDDTVLSLNIHSVSYKPVDLNWQSDYLDVTEDNPTLRYLCSFQDLTVCLDTRGRSGNVETFEEPMVFRCHVDIRQHFTFSSHLSRHPCINKIHISINHLDINISEKQLPTVLHLLELCLNLYYKRIEINHQVEYKDNIVENKTDDTQGWASWAWSYVPPIMSYEDEALERVPQTIIVGLFVRNLQINFKFSRTSKLKQFYCNENFRSKSICELQMEGIMLEVLAKGVEVFSSDFSVAAAKLSHGNLFVGSKLLHQVNRNLVIVEAGETAYNFTEGSLFDDRCPENKREKIKYKLTKEEFIRFEPRDQLKAFCSKYFYKAVDGRDDIEIENEKFNDYLKIVDLTDYTQWSSTKERSWKYFKIGGNNCRVFISSYSVQCLDQLLDWSSTHNLKPYSLKENIKIVPPKDVLPGSLSFIPSRSTTIEISQMKIIISSFHHKNIKSNESKRFIAFTEDTSSPTVHDKVESCLLPALYTTVPSINFKVIQPMYGKHLSALLSTFLAPPKQVVRSCYTQYDLEVPCIQCSLVSSNPLNLENFMAHNETKNVMKIEKLSLKFDKLEGIESWKERLSMKTYQLKIYQQSIDLRLTPISLELLLHIFDSWLLLFNSKFVAENIIDVTYIPSLQTQYNVNTLYLNVRFHEIIFEFAKTVSSSCCGGALESCDAFWTLNKNNFCFIQCNCKVNKPCSLKEFKTLDNSGDRVGLFTRDGNWNETSHCLTFLLQQPLESDKKGCLLFNLHHISICVDISILSALLNCYYILPSFLMPSLFNYLQTNVNEVKLSDDRLSIYNLQETFLRNLLQINTRGIQLFLLTTESQTGPHYLKNEIYSQSIANHLLKSKKKFKLWAFSFPMIVALTAGHKKLPINSKLIKTGTNVNMFTEFESLNSGFETFEVYSLYRQAEGFEVCCDQLVESFSATCTIACTNVKKDQACVSLHLDVEPVEVNVSAAHFSPQATFMTSAFSLVEDIYHKIRGSYVDIDYKSRTKKPLVDSLSAISFESKPLMEKKTSDWSVSVWLQCTISKIVLNFIDETSYFYKTSVFLEDISWSLDKQLVYLKILCSFNSCNIHQFPNSGTNTCLDGISLTPMYSIVPPFIKTDSCSSITHRDFPLHRTTCEQKPGKFVEIVFTRALVEDYHKNKLCLELEDTEDARKKRLPMKEYINEILFNMQAFDILINPSAVQDLFINLFVEAFKVLKIKDSDASKDRVFDIPHLYVDIQGCRILVPISTNEQKLTGLSQDVFMVCFNQLQVNCKPQNKISRLVLATDVYEQAQMFDLLNCPGSCLQDLQFECTIDDISVGGADWLEIVHSINQSQPCDNPALLWNTNSEEASQIGPNFYPVVDQFDVLIIYAPQISYLGSDGIKVLVCAPSFELDLLKDCHLHLNLANCLLITQAFMTFQNLLHQQLEDEDQIFTAFESTYSSSQTSSKPVKASRSRLMGEYLLTGKDIIIYFYQTVDKNIYKLLSSLNIIQPSLLSYVSKKQEKVELQVHDLSLSVSSSDKDYFQVFETKNLVVDTRTGVPSSFMLATINNFLTRKASLSILINRPLYISMSSLVIETSCLWLKEVQSLISELLLKKNTYQPTTSGFHDNQQPPFSKLKLKTSQINVQLKYLDNNFKLLIENVQTCTCVCESQYSTDVDINNISFQLQSDLHQSFIFLPFSITSNFTVSGISLVPDKIRRLSIKVSPLEVRLSPLIAHLLVETVQVVRNWLVKVTSTLPQRTVSSLTSFTSPVYIENLDDLRRGSYEYITTSDVTTLPSAGQIAFYEDSSFSALSWCNKQPIRITRIAIVPVMLTTDDVTTIDCSLQFYDEANQKYENARDFVIEASTASQLDVSGDDTIVSQRWRVVVHSNHLSPKMLAASLKVDCVFDSNALPSLLVCFDVSHVVVVSNDHVTSTQVVERAKLVVDDVTGSFRLCLQNRAFTFVLLPSMMTSLFLLNYHHLTWIPTVLPFAVSGSLSSTPAALSATCIFPDDVELRLSGRSLKSLQSLVTSWSQSSVKNTAYVISNVTETPLLIGQSATGECITLEARSRLDYVLPSDRIEPKLHLALKCHLGFSWCKPFNISRDDIIVRYFGEDCAIVVTVETNERLETTICIGGYARLINRLDFDVWIDGLAGNQCLKAGGDPIQSLIPSSAIKSMSCRASMTSKSSAVDVTELFGERARCLLQLKDKDEKMKYLQVISYTENNQEVISFSPIFIIRSHLPTSCVLHIHTRSLNQHLQLEIEGRGAERSIDHLNHLLTHHISVQLPSEKPFEAAVPVSGSLLDSIDQKYGPERPDLKLDQHYPYHKLDEDIYEVVDTWRHEEGYIKAKLSMYKRAILLEVTPWCLINNITHLSMCFATSSGDTTFIQADHVVVPLHCARQFTLRTSGSSVSDWFSIEADSEHPSRAPKSSNLKLWDASSHVCSLKRNNQLLDLLITSSFRCGIFILTISPHWIISNLSSRSIRVSPRLTSLCDVINTARDHEIALSSDFQPLIEWRDVRSVDDAIEVTSDDSTSSFLCLEHPTNVDTCRVADRVIRFVTSDDVTGDDVTGYLSVNEDFVRKVLRLRAPSTPQTLQQMYVTREVDRGRVYLVAGDVTTPNTSFYNHTDLLLIIKELTDDVSDAIQLPAHAHLDYECEAFSKQFPRCKRTASSLPFAVGCHGNEECVEMNVKPHGGSNELILAEGLVLWFKVETGAPLKVHFYDDPKSRRDHDVIIDTSSFNLVANHLKVVCLDDVTSPTHALDVLQICLSHVGLEVKDNLSKWTVTLSADDVQCDAHICNQYPVFMTSSPRDERFSIDLVINKDFNIEVIDVKMKSVEVMCEDGYLKLLALLFDVYSKALRPTTTSTNHNWSTTTSTNIWSNARALMEAPQLDYLQIRPFNLVVTLNTTYKVEVTLYKGTIALSRFLRIDICCRWSDIFNDLFAHYFADVVFGAGWMLGSADIIGNPLTTLRDFSRGLSDFFLLPYASMGSGPSAFLSGLTGGLSSLMRNVSYGLLTSLTNVASGLSRNISDRHKPVFAANIPDSDVTIYLPCGDVTSSDDVTTKPGYLSKMVKVMTSPLGGAASLVSRVGSTIIDKSGMNLHLASQHLPASHVISCYGNSLQNFSRKVDGYFGDDVIRPSCVAMMRCEASRVWVLSNDSLYIIRLDDDTIESVLAIEDYVITMTSSTPVEVELRNREDYLLPSRSNKVAEYLGFETADDVITARFSTICYEDWEARQFCEIFRMLTRH